MFRAPLDLARDDIQEAAGYPCQIGWIDGELVVAGGGASGRMEAQYLLDPRPVHLIDCDQLNLWVHTDPRSMVWQQLVALRVLPTGARSIRGGRLVIDEPGRKLERDLQPSELGAVLREEFGLTLPAPIPKLVRSGVA